MLLNKKVFYFSFIISLITLSLSIWFYFFYDNEIIDFICNILLNIFAGTIVLMVTSLFDYFIQKRRILTAIMDKIHKYRRLICNIHYLEDINSYPSYEQYKAYYKNKSKDFKYTKKMYDEEKNREFKKRLKEMNKIINEYMEILSIDFTDMWLLYDELYFISPFERWTQKRNWCYENIFNYINNLLIEIQKSSYYFDLYKENNRFEEECYKVILELQKNLFNYEKLYGEDYNWSYELKENEYANLSGFSEIDNSHFMVINKFEKHLSNMFNELHKLNYPKKHKK